MDARDDKQRRTDFEAYSDDMEPPKPRRRAYADLSERWVPYKQINGISVYHHLEDDAADGVYGGEYMVSAVIRGPPVDVLDVLLGGCSNTTLLGPASEVEVLETSEEGEGEESEGRMDKEVGGMGGRPSSSLFRWLVLITTQDFDI